ncbi:PREDICTED: uncharacterized protein LOC105962398 isoform X2 [Erythranthe guttata]|uniref:uncharacterized protein LOC105962398 isoform X2 n=1 Tax=Erythranthe guttata TaxID=4155 RepID=UPI00064D9B42|nr:PREDICTED: uncharacterized protein LOC105962398 isoform X2 [Erythranthe guttata]|eukprot:XP_012842157.1 PREDICTED: uncharacterized protein LOC105962398 isoform X2 [Erythranthe guttata]
MRFFRVFNFSKICASGKGFERICREKASNLDLIYSFVLYAMIKAKHISHICSTVKNRAIFNKSSNTEEGSSSLFIPCNKGLARSKEVDKKLGRSLLIVQEIRTFLPHKLSSSKRSYF